MCEMKKKKKSPEPLALSNLTQRGSIWDNKDGARRR